jgi:hypothetical protein
MTKRRSAPPAPAPLEAYCQQFDPLFGKLNQREAFRSYLAGLLLPAERNKTITALANTEPGVGAQRSAAQKLQWFLSESSWDWRAVNEQRLALLRADALTAPNDHGVLVIDESGDRKWGTKTAHVGRQYLANLGKIDSGVVSVTSLWADERMYWPVEFEPYTPAHWFERGRSDPQFRTKLTIGAELVGRAVERGLPFRAVVADCFYGEDPGFQRALDDSDVGYVLALKPSHAWWHPIDKIGSLWEGAQVAGWVSPERPGAWEKVQRQFRDGHCETWWALETAYGPYGPDKRLRAVVVTTDPAELPELTTWYLLTNLPAPGTARARASGLEPADLAEISRLYGLRAWVEQSYKQTKHALGWSQYQVRSDLAIRRHWELVCCAFSFCWHNQSHAAAATKAVVGRGENRRGVVATGTQSGQGLAGAVDPAGALLDSVVKVPPTAPATRTA